MYRRITFYVGGKDSGILNSFLAILASRNLILASVFLISSARLLSLKSDPLTGLIDPDVEQLYKDIVSRSHKNLNGRITKKVNILTQ